MKYKKTFFIFTILVFFSGCGYTPIFSKKDANFSIEKLEISGNRIVKENITKNLFNYKNKPNKNNKISLIIETSKSTTIASRNIKGEAQTKRVAVNVKTKIILSEGKFFDKSFDKSLNYTATKNKSSEKSIENKLIENISNEIAQQIILEILKKTSQ